MGQGDTPLLLLSLAAATGLSLTALYTAIARRHSRTWKSGVVILLASAEFISARAFQVVSPDDSGRVFMYQMCLCGLALIPSAFLWLALVYSGVSAKVLRLAHSLLVVLPALLIVMIFTNDRHGWAWNPPSTLLTARSLSSLTPIDAHLGFWLLIAYAYLAMGLGCFFLSRALVRSRHVYGWQAGGIVVAALVAWSMANLDILPLSPFPPFVATATGLTIAVITVALSLSGLRRRDLMSVSREAMVSRISDCILFVDGDNRVVDLNPAVEHVAGKPASQMIGKPLAASFPELNAAAAEAAGLSSEVVLRRDTRAFTFDVRLSNVRDGQGRLAGRVIVLRDISQRKTIENALRTSEERYALATRGSNDGIWDWDLKTDLVYFSPRWKAMLGYGEQDLISSPEEWFQRVHPDDLEHFKADLAEHLEGRSPHFEQEHRMLHGDGSYRWMLTRGLALRDSSGKAYRIAGSQTDITRRRVAEDQLRYDSMHEPLTGLPNRTLFTDRLDHILKSAKRRKDAVAAVFFMDLDRFKMVNDSLGHSMGDQLLIAVARRLEGCLRSADTLARFGGDEFAILLEGVREPAAAIASAERIQLALQPPFEVEGHTLSISASIGIALTWSDSPAGRYKLPEEILSDADAAMYLAKEQGKARCVVFDPSLRARATAALEMETDLRQALERQEFLLHYQPILSLATGQVSAVEALVRWLHPKRGLVQPAEFIRTAEETGLIVPLGEWILQTGCAQIQAWHAAGWPNLRLAINLSARQLRDPGLIQSVQRALTQTGMIPQLLDVELTEGAAMEDVAKSIQILNELDAMGARIVIDDFGSGYSSLNYLRQFPARALKIDRCFVGEIANREGDAAITPAVIALARNLNLDVVAEGIETIEQLELLRWHECAYGQGFLFSCPEPPERVVRLLSRPWCKLEEAVA